MARWFEHVPGGSTRYTKTTRAASIAAGGALVLATLVAAPTSALADDDAYEYSPAAAPAPHARAATTGEPTVLGLIVEHEGRSLGIGSPGTGIQGIGKFKVASDSPGQSLVNFTEQTDLDSAERLAAHLKAQSGVKEVSLNLLNTVQALPPGGRPSDPHYENLHGLWDERSRFEFTINGRPYNVKMPKGGFSTKAPALWQLTKGSKDVVVAVLDTGSTTHPDLDSNTVAGYDMISSGGSAGDGDGRDANPRDEGDWVNADECRNYIDGYPPHLGRPRSSWHGTHVAGTIAAAENGIGVIGNAPRVKIQHVRVLGKCGGTTKDVADGITWASGGQVPGVPDNSTPAKVLNLSLGGYGDCEPVTQKAINDARKRGSVVIVAAGNENVNVNEFQPANCKNVITVGATDWIGGQTTYSNYGKRVDVSAPGGAISDWSGNANAGIYSTWNDGITRQASAGYAYYEGTSMATPGVAGVAALIVSLRPKIKPKQLERVIKQSIRKFPKRPYYGDKNCRKGNRCGNGLIDAARVPTTFLAKPKIKNVRVGRKAKVNVKAAAPSTNFHYQWLRNGKKIKGATKKTYKVKKKDRGKRLSVRVTARHSASGIPNSKATSKKVKVKKNKPKVKISLVKKKIKRSARPRVKVTVNVGHLTKRPHGKLRASYGKKSKTFNLKKGRKGKVTLKLPKLKKGKHTIRVRYIPAKGLKKHVAAANSKKVTIRVR